MSAFGGKADEIVGKADIRRIALARQDEDRNGAAVQVNKSRIVPRIWTCGSTTEGFPETGLIFPVSSKKFPVRVKNFPVMARREFSKKSAHFQWLTRGPRPLKALIL